MPDTTIRHSVADQRTITATLIRGKVYSYFHPKENKYTLFVRNVPQEVSAEVAAVLEVLEDETFTDDKELVLRETFRVDYNAEKRVVEESAAARPRRLRMKLVPEEVVKEAKPVLRREGTVPGRTGTLRVGGSRS